MRGEFDALLERGILAHGSLRLRGEVGDSTSAAAPEMLSQECAQAGGVDAKHINDDALARGVSFNYPGNVRQLENLCHWLAIMAPAQVVELTDLPPQIVCGVAAASPVAGAPAGLGLPSTPDASSVCGQLAPDAVVSAPVPVWLSELRRGARRRLEANEPEEQLPQQFEERPHPDRARSQALRRIEAA